MSAAVTMERMTGASPRRMARIAGLLYLIGSVAGVFGILYGPSLVVPGDAAATAKHILASESLFRLSIVSALLDQIIFVFVVLALSCILTNSKSEALHEGTWHQLVAPVPDRL
jgi:Domain of unknown function (DUF4386)